MKTCPKCEKSLLESEFGVRADGRLQYWCRACQCAYMRVYQAQHKPYYDKLRGERRLRKRHMILEAKDRPCADCGRCYPPYVMDFDHRPGEKKCFNVSSVLSRGTMSFETIRAEIAKCDVVCANCHRERSYQRKQLARQATSPEE